MLAAFYFDMNKFQLNQSLIDATITDHDLEVFAAVLQDNVEPQPPLDPNELTGTTPEEKAQSLSGEFADLLSTSPNPVADAYGGTSAKPFYGYASPDHLLPVYQRYQQFQQYLAQSQDEQAKGLLKAFGGNPQQVIALALQEAGTRYSPNTAPLFSGRLGKGQLQNFLGSDASVQDKRTAVNAYRNHMVGALQAEVRAKVKDWNTTHGIDLAEATHLLHKRKAEKIGRDPGAFITKVGGLNVANQLREQADDVLMSRISQLNSDKLLLSPYWTKQQLGEEDDPSHLDPISRHEVLGPLGLTLQAFPSDPSEEFETGYTYTHGKDLGNTIRDRREIMRNNPNNINTLKYYLQNGGFTSGEQISAALKDGEGINGDNRHSVDVMRYVYQSLCENNPKLFSEMLGKAGFGATSKTLSQKVITDTDFESYGLSFRSKAEAKVVNKFRQTFGLMAIPYPLTIPAPSDCPTNDYFTVDFTIPCDVLDHWAADQAGIPHPKVNNTVVFVGEYYGFGMDSPSRIPQGQDWNDIDGNIATTQGKDGQPIEMRSGAVVTETDKYNLRKNWKQMTENVVAQASGYRAIAIDKDLRDRPIMGQLDRNEIIYQTSVCPVGDNTCSVAYHQLLWHAKTCKDPRCDVWKYVSQQPNGELEAKPVNYSPAESYILSCIADCKMQYGMVPLMNYASSGNWTRDRMYQYYTQQQKLDAYRHKLWTDYTVSFKTDPHSSETNRILQTYREAQQQYEIMRQDYMSALHEDYEQKIQSDQDLQRRLNGLQSLLEYVKQAVAKGENIPGSEIVHRCQQFVKPIVPRPKVPRQPTAFRWYSDSHFAQ